MPRKPPRFTYGTDWLDRPIILEVSATTSLTDPLAGLGSRAREAIIFRPMTREERTVVRMCRNLPYGEKRVVAHWLISERRDVYEQEQKREMARASHERRMDVVEDERRRAERHSRYLAAQAAKPPAPRAPVEKPSPPLPSSAKTPAGPEARMKELDAGTALTPAVTDHATRLDEWDRDDEREL